MVVDYEPEQQTKMAASTWWPLATWLALLALVLPSVITVRVHSIHWNTSNPIFRIDNTDNVLDVNEGNLPWEYDQLNLICPWYRREELSEREEVEQYIIYSVSREEYDSCIISQKQPRVVAVCNKPDTHQQFTITFRSFSPTPRGLEFHPGHDYFFVSTSTPTDLYLRSGGACRSHNMKVTFKVADNRAAAGAPAVGRQHQGAAAVNSPRRSALPPLPSSDSDVDDEDEEDDGDVRDVVDDNDLSEDTGGDVISRSINNNRQNNNAYVRPIEDTRTFRSGLDQLYGGGTTASQRRDSGGKHLPSTLSAGASTGCPGRHLLLFLLFLLRGLLLPC